MTLRLSLPDLSLFVLDQRPADHSPWIKSSPVTNCVNKVYQNTTLLSCLPVVSGFCCTIAKSSRWIVATDCMGYKTKNTYYLALYWKSLLTPVLDYEHSGTGHTDRARQPQICKSNCIYHFWSRTCFGMRGPQKHPCLSLSVTPTLALYPPKSSPRNHDTSLHNSTSIARAHTVCWVL